MTTTIPARWTATSEIPARCTDADLYRGLGYARATFYRMKARGAFQFLEIQPPILGAPTQYSGHLIAKWLRGDVRQGQPRQFFAAARKRAAR